MASVTRILPHHHVSGHDDQSQRPIDRDSHLSSLATAYKRPLLFLQWPLSVNGIPQGCRATQLESFDGAARGLQGERKWRGISGVWFQKTGEVSTWQAVSSGQLPLLCVCAEHMQNGLQPPPIARRDHSLPAEPSVRHSRASPDATASPAPNPAGCACQSRLNPARNVGTRSSAC
jgi:hypothetical protein